MEPRFTRGEYWLLETVVESATPLCYLSSKHVEEIFNKPGHGMARNELIESLDRLFAAGLIGARDNARNTCSSLLTRQEIERHLDVTRPVENADCASYGLTFEGGRAWEAFAAPRWERFIVRFERPRGGRWQVGVVISPTAWQVDRLLDGAEHMGQAIDWGLVRRKTLRPWRATYWKTLDIGHMARYRFESNGRCGFREAPYWFMELIENRWYRWS